MPGRTGPGGGEQRRPVAEEAARLADLRWSRLLPGNEPLVRTVGRVTQLARAAVPAVDEVSLTLVEDRRPQTLAATGEVAVQLDRWQYDSGRGPCLDAARTGRVVLVVDMSSDDRYPQFTAAALRAGVVRSLSVGVTVPGPAVAGLNMYARSGSGFDEATLAAADSFAALAAVTLSNAALYARAAQEVRQLRDGVASRAVIEQAKGMVIAARGCTADEAFDELRRLSNVAERKLRVVAEEVVATRGRLL